jgi:toluene monooxygenase system protein E
VSADPAPQRPRRRRTFSAFGDVRKMPSEYEIVTHEQNWTLRANRTAPFEQNPSSPANLWFLTYRDRSPLRVEDWEGFRDPDALTYKSYVNLQSDAEARVQGALEAHADAQNDARLSPEWLALLGHLMTPSRYLFHGFQQIEAYIGYIAPSSYITNAAGFATADFLRRVTTIAYRTRELQLSRPDSGIGAREREIWEREPAWQPARKAVEHALVSYDWGEAFTALNLVLAPTLEHVMHDSFKQAATDAHDELDWLLATYLAVDGDRRSRWSGALVRYAVSQEPGNAQVIRKWSDRWASAADEAAEGLGRLLEPLSLSGLTAVDVAARAREHREALLAEALSTSPVATTA